MPDEDIRGTDWTATENDLIVADYLEMLKLELAGYSFVKSRRNEALRQFVKRSAGSIEFKHQNISAVLKLLGLPWIQGYKPLPNYQQSLTQAIDRAISPLGAIASIASPPTISEMQEAPQLFFEQPPQREDTIHVESDEALKRLFRKFDPVERDHRNRELGKNGEEFVFKAERSRLAGVNSILADKVRWVSRDDGDGAGFDILSFENDGRERLLEVKTTLGGQTTPFYISANEINLSAKRPDAFKLVRLFDFARIPRAFELRPPLDQFVSLKPNSFLASFN